MATFTIGELLIRVRDQVNEQSIATGFWTDSALYRYAYDAQVELALECGVLERRQTFYTTTTGTAEYSYPIGVHLIQHITWDTRKIQSVDFREFMVATNSDGTSTTVSGPVNYYYTYGQAGQGGIIGLVPPPNKSAPVVGYFIGVPSDGPGSYTTATTIEVGQQYAPLLQNYVLWKAWNKEQSPEGQRQAEGNRQMWMDGVARVRRLKQEAKRGDRFAVVKDVDRFFNSDFGMI